MLYHWRELKRRSGIQNLCILVSFFFFLALFGCSSLSKPCQEGGDVTWEPPLKGNSQCRQIKNANGKYVNDGYFVQYHPNGKLALEGKFKEGLKEGVWTQYNDEGRPVKEKLFIRGVEKAPRYSDVVPASRETSQSNSEIRSTR